MNSSGKPQSIVFNCLKVSQPIGDFYIASIDSKSLYTISYADIRRITDRDVEKYLGIQRPLDEKRVKDLKQYVSMADACFPTGIILSVDGVCCEYDEQNHRMTLKEYVDPENSERSIEFERIAKILDGQHRLEGLLGFAGPKFDLNVSIFVDIDISDQANIFSTVNLAQTKVNRSLAYDLFDLAKSRSPEKTCHLIAVALDKQEKSPFYKKIKRLGVSTDGRFDEKITQATLVKSLLPYISDNPSRDRDLYLRGKKPKEASAGEIEKMIFRNMFLEEKDLEIAEVLFRYFSVVKNKWSQAWGSSGTGDILNRTNGFRALMRFLRPVYLYLGNPGMVPTVEQFSKVFDRIDMKDSEFNVDNFKPGTSGESKLYLTFLEKSRLQG